MEKVEEGRVSFGVGGAFYRPETRIVRDLGVLAGWVYRQQVGALRVLDAMTGCGVRSLRYGAESGASWVWANEGNRDLGGLLGENLGGAIASGHCKLTFENAHRVFFHCYSEQDYYDLVDVDCFGSAAPYYSTALWAVKIGGLLYLTSTDGRSATGHLPGKSLQDYGAFARSHPAAHEQGLRLLLGALQQEAASRGMGIQPIFSLYRGNTYRVMVRLGAKVRLTPQNYGFLGYCHHCGDYQGVAWEKLGRSLCLRDERPLTLTGPMWLGELGDRIFLDAMRSSLLPQLDSSLPPLLDLLQAEADFPPYFYTLQAIGKRGKLDLPPKAQLIQALQAQGYRATATHLNAQGLKTTASLATCIAVARGI
ncbi:hypothetical protein [Spirulina subsalsa]|uniref:hypothetical protein n=1 Tax=Spirulina subsalsa TaxID=54311 RepID=UPI00031BEB7D|nr:hypothetical protein [Spirulina subsalsa]